ncbi:unnamed protein product [Moneuplotes crassus]|uniref:Uncharacterized protein n=1 Tax=Euplotes crassus TaxID=5936 RepID=A0AAD1XXG7_EUPCR|nr:unnamed protein product [Moneuplotes crassus]
MKRESPKEFRVHHEVTKNIYDCRLRTLEFCWAAVEDLTQSSSSLSIHFLMVILCSHIHCLFILCSFIYKA